jgi:hypothetical protein
MANTMAPMAMPVAGSEKAVSTDDPSIPPLTGAGGDVYVLVSNMRGPTTPKDAIAIANSDSPATNRE